ncbi:MAG: formylglycine-generating enzyme family protein [Planctomycetaceae bacterium]|nr:formylglycine-generating enzyme family protein [Planctomycetaceae bacterium]
MKRILFAFLFLFLFVLTAAAREHSYPEFVIEGSGKIACEGAEIKPEDSGTARKAGDRMVKMADGIEYAFRWCPAGTFTMGSSISEWDAAGISWKSYDEERHSVTLTKGFWMLETEVTQAMWKSVMGTTVRQQRDKGNPDWPLRGEGSDYPIYYVNWEESGTFCEQLSSKLGVQVSLPTEAQWEYACRAGTTGVYAGDLDAMAWYDSNSGSKTHPVGQKKANEWGLYDMHGNVWEWCLDVYEKDFYVRSPSSDPCNWKDENSGSRRVARGGGWDYSAGNCRSANRDFLVPGSRSSSLGFRIVLADPAPGK